MRIVKEPIATPNICCATLKAKEKEGFFDTNNELVSLDPHIYISVAWVREAARYLGYVRSEKYAELEAEIVALQDRIDGMEAENAELSRDFEAIEQLQSKGYVSRKKPGRPKKEAVGV